MILIKTAFFFLPIFLPIREISIVCREGIVVSYQMMAKCYWTSYINSYFCFCKLLQNQSVCQAATQTVDNLNQKKFSNNERRNSKWTAEVEEQKDKGKNKCF